MPPAPRDVRPLALALRLLPILVAFVFRHWFRNELTYLQSIISLDNIDINDQQG
jgi:hypothetical protein